MTIEEVEIASLSVDPANVRTHSARNLEAIKGSLRRFGQQKPIVVDGSNVVRAGNGTLAAAIALGWERIKVVRTNLTGSEAVGYAIADNRTGDESIGSTFDQATLTEVLAALNAEDAELASSTGFTVEEIAGLLTAQSVASQPAAQPPADFPSVDESLQTDHECPRCHYRWSGSTAPQEAA